ncbi:MAG: hypothetical protein R3244_07300 [Thermoanaerobaculia bacterium]|nr:hypothetical protein [Thermoanaerobaculia bacterium]
MNELTTHALFTEYIHVVNQVLGSNRERPVFRPIIEGAERFLDDRRLGIGVYTDDADSPHDWFTTKLDDGTFELVAHGKEDVDLTCRVSREHLKTVVENRSEFVTKPYKLDLDWLKTRLQDLAN